MLHAMISGEMDVDRMDYLLRDSYFAGVQYGGYDLPWLISKAIAVPDGEAMRLGIDIQALPAFEHFLLARYHMFQMVYFHPKSDIYDTMLRQWLASVGDEARFPSDPEAYIQCDDAWLMARLAASPSPWAQRVCTQDPLRLVVELRGGVDDQRADLLEAALAEAGLDSIRLTAQPVLSRYARAPAHLRTNPLLVRDGLNGDGSPRYLRVEEVTDLFGRYEQTRRMQRFYVPPDQRAAAEAVLSRWRSAE